MIIFNRQNIFHQNDYSVITTGPFFCSNNATNADFAEEASINKSATLYLTSVVLFTRGRLEEICKVHL